MGDAASRSVFEGAYGVYSEQNPFAGGPKAETVPMPVRLFERFGFAGRDLTTMWRWLRTGTVDLDTAPTRWRYEAG